MCVEDEDGGHAGEDDGHSLEILSEIVYIRHKKLSLKMWSPETVAKPFLGSKLSVKIIQCVALVNLNYIHKMLYV